MKKLTSFLFIIFLLSILSPVIDSIHITKKYSYTSEEQVQKLHFRELLEPTASLENIQNTIFWKQATGDVHFALGQNMFTMKIPKTSS